MPVIATNNAANTALRYLNQNAQDQSSTLSKLASGSRITKASDDAAGLAVGTRLQADVTVLNQAQTNTAQGNAVLQTADGGMARISDILQRMKALAAQSNSGSVTDTGRAYISEEFKQLTSEIDTIASSTRFNNVSLLNANSTWSSGISFMVGTTTTDKITISITSVSASSLGVSAASVSTQSNATTALDMIDSAIDTISSARAKIGAQMSRFDFQSQTIATSVENTSAAQSVYMDADVAAEKTSLASADVKTQAAIAALTQANQIPQQLLSLLKS